MKPSTSFILGIVTGIVALVVIDRVRKGISEEDVEAIKNKIGDSLSSLESTLSGIAEGLTEHAH